MWYGRYSSKDQDMQINQHVQKHWENILHTLIITWMQRPTVSPWFSSSTKVLFFPQSMIMGPEFIEKIVVNSFVTATYCKQTSVTYKPTWVQRILNSLWTGEYINALDLSIGVLIRQPTWQLKLTSTLKIRNFQLE